MMVAGICLGGLALMWLVGVEPTFWETATPAHKAAAHAGHAALLASVGLFVWGVLRALRSQ